VADGACACRSDKTLKQLVPGSMIPSREQPLKPSSFVHWKARTSSALSWNSGGSHTHDARMFRTHIYTHARARTPHTHTHPSPNPSPNPNLTHTRTRARSHFAHAQLWCLSAGPHTNRRLFEELRDVYNAVRPTGSRPAPYFGEWQSLADICSHPLCRCELRHVCI